MSSCTDVALGEQLLGCSESEIAERAELAAHLRTCAGCRGLVEQRRRLAAHWDRRELAQSDLLRLQARLFRSAKVPAASKRPVVVGALAFALFAAVAAAATYATVSEKPSPSVSVPPPLSAPTPSRVSMSFAPPVNPPSSVSTGPVVAAVPPARSAAANARPKLAGVNTDPRWVTVAEAQQRHDWPAAEQALTALTRTGDSPSRDAARLTLAELWLQSGRAAQAKPVLRDLAAHGSTATIRARAATLLEPFGG